MVHHDAFDGGRWSGVPNLEPAIDRRRFWPAELQHCFLLVMGQLDGPTT